MLKFFKYKLAFFSRLHCTLLIFVWIIGQCVGCFTAMQVPDSYSLLMRLPGFTQVSIVWLAFSAVVPFLLSYIAMRFNLRILLVPILFLKSYAFTYCLCCVSIAFDDACWLFCWLILFTDCCCSILYLFFVLRYFNRTAKSQKRMLFVSIAIINMIVCIDYFVVLPFSALLLNC